MVGCSNWALQGFTEFREKKKSALYFIFNQRFTGPGLSTF